MSQYVIGIDLGTTNSALAYAPLRRAVAGQPFSNSSARRIRANWPISICFRRRSTFPAKRNSSKARSPCPGMRSHSYVTGRLAWLRGVENSGRLVASAKSWLSNQSSDPTQPLLPLAAPDGVPKISPVDASTQYLCTCARLGT